MIPRGILQTIIKLRNMTKDEIVEYFTERSNRIKGSKNNWTPLQHALDQEKWHGLKNERTYSRHFN